MRALRIERPGAGTAAYPGECDVDVALRDGSTLHVRPVIAADRPAVHAFLTALSPESIGFRFFGGANLDWAAGWSVDVDYAERYALIATTGMDQRIVAHGAYVHTADERAEVAFVVSDDWQGHGIATIMLAHLAAVAEQHSISLFTAEVLPHNHRMIAVFRDSGFPVAQRFADGVTEIELPTSLSPQALERFEQREQTAAVAAMRCFLHPRSVAVIGASRRRRSVGGQILRNVLCGGFTGAVYPVNSHARTVQGRRAYATIGEVPEPVELAVIAVPAAHVNDVARACAASPASPAVSGAPSRSSRSRAGARRPERAPPPRTRARCLRPPT